MLVVADVLHGDDGTAVGTQGFFIDVTPSVTTRQNAVSIQVSEIAERRAVIEQAKGMLMLIFDLDDSAAFELLRWRSQSKNVRLYLLARQLIRDFRSVRHSDTPLPRSTFDRLLLTAHTRVEGVPLSSETLTNGATKSPAG